MNHNFLARIRHFLLLGILCWLVMPVVAAESYPTDFPDVLAVTITERHGVLTVAATLSSPYDSPQRYADAFRILDEQGNELAVRVLLHDHANEQPFTRSLSQFLLPNGVNTITVQGRDSINGWGGKTVSVEVP